LSGGNRSGTLSMKPGRTVKNRPVASSSFCKKADRVGTVRRGGSYPFARNVSAMMEPKALS
jgi:hypothetical protein